MSNGPMKFPAVLSDSLARALAPSPSTKSAVAQRRPLHSLRALAGLQAVWKWLVRRRKAHQGSRQLQLIETLHMGEKRFIAMVEAGGARYLLGGGAGQLSLLTRLDAPHVPQASAEPAGPRPWEQP